MSGYVSIGRVMIAAGVPKAGNNGSAVAPAIVTAVNGNYVNARLLLDGPDVAWWTSRPVFDNWTAYDKAAAEHVENYPDSGPLQALYWPTRTP